MNSIILFPQSTEHLGEVYPLVETIGTGIVRHRAKKRRYKTHRKQLTKTELEKRQDNLEWRKVWRHYVFGEIDAKAARAQIKELRKYLW